MWSAGPKFINVIIRGNSAKGRGAGIYQSGGSLSLEDCVLRGNRSLDKGGGICSFGAHLSLDRCIFRENSAREGGGMYADVDQLVVNDCEFHRNDADEEGGGLFAWGGTTVRNCTFVGNTALDGGGAAGYVTSVINSRFLGNSAARNGGGLLALGSTITHCIFSGNHAGEDGGGLRGTAFSVSHCAFARNVAGMSGGGIEVSSESWQTTVASSILWGNLGLNGKTRRAQISAGPSAVRVSYTCIQRLGDRGPDGSGNIGTRPRFVDSRGPDGIAGTEDDNLRLKRRSPGIDAGVNDFVLPDIFDLDGDGDTQEPTPFDLDGQPRRFDDPKTPDTGWGKAPMVDMGAYEFSGLCQSIRRIKVRCNEAGTLVATFKTRLEEGRWLRASITNGRAVQVFIGSRGRGKAKWRDLPGGTYKVCVVECPDKCRAADCD